MVTKEGNGQSWKGWVLGIVGTVIVASFGSLTTFVVSLNTSDAAQNAKLSSIEARLDRMPKEGSDDVVISKFDDLNRRIGNIEATIEKIDAKLDRLVSKP